MKVISTDCVVLSHLAHIDFNVMSHGRVANNEKERPMSQGCLTQLPKVKALDKMVLY